MTKETQAPRSRDKPIATMHSAVSTLPVHPQPHRFSVKDYLAMGEAGILQPEDRVELVRGQVLSMSPIGHGHAVSVDRLSRLLHGQGPEVILVHVQNAVNFADDTQVQPDLALLRDRQGFWQTGVREEDCLLVIEVAETSLETDRTRRLALYAAAGIPEYWIVDLPGRRVECYLNPEGEAYTQRSVHEVDEVVTSWSIPGLSIPILEIVPPGE
jgi:Uma2 family endonuclease